MAVKKSKVSFREKAAKEQDKSPKPEKKQRTKKLIKPATKPIKKAASLAKKEYYLPIPDTKAGNFLNKKRHFIPKYFRESWKELKLVTWPNRKQTIKLTFAVFMFAIIFGIIIALVDYGLDVLFRKVIL